MNDFELQVSPADAGGRLDVLASELSGLTRSQIKQYIERGLLNVNGHISKQNYRTKTGDIISIHIPDIHQELLMENLPIDVFFLDDFIIVVNKPPDMVVYPAAGYSRGTLMNAIAYYSKKLASIGGPLRPGVVHRLDKDTSGVMVVALNDMAYYNLVEQFKNRTINRKYKAIVYGNLKGDSGEISLSIGRSESDRKKMSTKTKKGKEAVTGWRVVERLNGATLIEARLGTGRTHQIRVHFASIGHPVLGDKVYGKKTCLEIKKKKIVFSRQMLHAELLGFNHPETGQHMEFISALPLDMQEKIRELREI